MFREMSQAYFLEVAGLVDFLFHSDGKKTTNNKPTHKSVKDI